MQLLRRIIIGAFLVCCFLLYVSQHAFRQALESKITWSQLPNENDFFHYYKSANAALRGEQVYCRRFDKLDAVDKTIIDTATNPPLLITLTIPLALLPPLPAWVVWQLFLVFCTAISVAILCRILKFSVSFYLLLLPIVCFSNPVIAALRFAQIQPLILLLLVGTLYFNLKHQDFKAGVLLGLSIGLKFFTAPLIFLFLGDKRYRAALITVSIALLLNLPFLFSSNISLIDFHNCAGLEITRWIQKASYNQSIFGICKNIISMFFGYDLDLVSKVNRTLTLIAPYLIVFPCSLIYFTTHISKLYSFSHKFSIALAITVLFGPLAWSHYYILLIIPIIIALNQLDAQNERFIFGLALFLLAPLTPVSFSLHNSRISYMSDDLLMRFVGWSTTFVPAILFILILTLLLLKFMRKVGSAAH